MGHRLHTVDKAEKSLARTLIMEALQSLTRIDDGSRILRMRKRAELIIAVIYVCIEKRDCHRSLSARIMPCSEEVVLLPHLLSMHRATSQCVPMLY